MRRTQPTTADEVGNVLVATETFVTEYDGERVTVRKGVTNVRAGHPIAEANPKRFKPVHVHFDVETAREEPPAPPAAATSRGGRTSSTSSSSTSGDGGNGKSKSS